ncbi:monocarboxylate transporter 13-like [Ptychodera flava]|uniref:monocarboxylate transporter 13-like n=1 Tax=Ptychodera flava TaxID=63121 RepID=UPI00396A3762
MAKTRLDTQSVPPDGGYGWVIVIAGFISFTLLNGTLYSFGVLFVALLRAFEGSKADTALIGAVFGGCSIVANPISLVLCNRFSHRKVMMVSGIGCAVSLILSSRTTSLLQLLFSYGVMASLFYFMVPLPALAMISRYFEKRLSIAMGLALAGSGFGQFTFSLGTQVLLDTYGWRGTLIILAGVSLHFCVAGALMKPLVENTHVEITESSQEGLPQTPLKSQCSPEHDDIMTARVVTSAEVSDDAGTPQIKRNDTCCSTKSALDVLVDNHDKISQKRSSSCNCHGVSSICRKVKKVLGMMYDVSLLRDIIFVLILFTAFSHAAGHFAVFSHVVKRARDFGIPSFKSSSLPAVTGLTQCIGRAFWGILGGRFKMLKPHLLYGFSLGICGLTSLISIYTTTYEGQLVYMIVFGFGMACYIPMSPMVVRYFVGADKFDGGMSMFMQAQGFGNILSPFVGWLRDTEGNYVIGFYMISVIYIASALCAIFLNKLRRFMNKRKEACNECELELDGIHNDSLSKTRHLYGHDAPERHEDAADSCNDIEVRMAGAQ